MAFILIKKIVFFYTSFQEMFDLNETYNVKYIMFHDIFSGKRGISPTNILGDDHRILIVDYGYIKTGIDRTS